MLLVIMICILIVTGILIHDKVQQEKAIKAIRGAVKTEIETEQKSENYNHIVATNCRTIQILIQEELVGSDYKTVKSHLTVREGNILFYESGIQIPGNGLQFRNGTNQEGWVVVSFDDALERFLINGNAFDGSDVFPEPLVVRS
jgi:hypothetical protein